jgi:hypothetical protein
MTEDEWLAATDPGPMLECLSRGPGAVEGWERKSALFACACCRRIWHLLPTEACRRTVEVAERYADGLATDRERYAARSSASASAAEERVPLDDGRYTPYRELLAREEAPSVHAVRATMALVGGEEFAADIVAREAAEELARNAVRVRKRKGFRHGTLAGTYDGMRAEEAAQSLLLRDVVGNPFRPSPDLGDVWLAGIVWKVGDAAYERRSLPSGALDPSRLAVLADALEEAGCTDPTILGHLRGPGPHVRGCWAMDLVLGKG